MLYPLLVQTTLQYGYAERLGDNRGITYGFCGFTTGTGDGLMVRWPTPLPLLQLSAGAAKPRARCRGSIAHCVHPAAMHTGGGRVYKAETRQSAGQVPARAARREDEG